MSIPLFSSPPSLSDLANFETDNDTTWSEFNPIITAMNAAISDVNADSDAAVAAAADAVAAAATATTKAGDASTSEINADASATAAAASAAEASGGAIPIYTWAGKPAAASNSQKRIRISDAGVSPGMVVVSDGTQWIPDGVQVLARSGIAASGAVDTNENTLATLTVPAALLATAGSLRLFLRTTTVGGVGTKTFRVRWSGGAGTIIYTSGTTTAGNGIARLRLRNANAANSQICETEASVAGSFTLQVATAAIDTTATATLVITCQKTTASETMTLNHYVLEVLP